MLSKDLLKDKEFHELANNNEKLRDIIKLSGGFLNARNNIINREGYSVNGSEIFDADLSLNEEIFDGDVIRSSINKCKSKTISLKGAIKYPSKYNFKKNMSLGDILSN